MQDFHWQRLRLLCLNQWWLPWWPSRMDSTNKQSKTSQNHRDFHTMWCFCLCEMMDFCQTLNDSHLLKLQCSEFFVQAIVGRIATNSELFRVGMRFFYVWFLRVRSQKMHGKKHGIFLEFSIIFHKIWLLHFLLLALLGLLLWDPLQNEQKISLDISVLKEEIVDPEEMASISSTKSTALLRESPGLSDEGSRHLGKTVKKRRLRGKLGWQGWSNPTNGYKNGL